MQLTAATIKALTLPPGKTDKAFFDDTLPGFGVRVLASGAKSWLVQYDRHGRTRRMSLGSINVLPLGQARETARKILSRVNIGEDPAGDKDKAAAQARETFKATAHKFIARQTPRWRKSTIYSRTNHLLVYAKSLHSAPLASIDRRAIARLLSDVSASSGLSSGNRLRASLSAFFSWCIREGLTDTNPVVGTNKNDEGGGRERVLTDDELRAVWRATNGDRQADRYDTQDGRYGAIVRLLMLTAMRRAEIGGLSWDEVDLNKAKISLPAERVKNKKPFELPLSPAALAILEAIPRRPDGDLVFGRPPHGFMTWKDKIGLDRRAGIAPWTLHDLRRTVSTKMNGELNIQPHIVEICLNHAGPRTGVAGIYNRATYLPEKAAALAQWAEHLLSIVEDRPAKVVSLRAQG